MTKICSFCFCQFLCCYAWGLISDYYGRRSSLLFGLVFSTIAIVLLGFSTSFVMALAARCIAGLFNGNLGVMKAYLADITDSSNRANAFSILAISYGLGSVLGSMCGGLFIETSDVDVPDDEYIATRGVIPFWILERDFPFLTACILGAFISGNAVIWVMCHVHDEKMNVNPLKRTNSVDSDSVHCDYEVAKVGAVEQQEGVPPTQSLNELSLRSQMEATPGDGIHSMNMIHSKRLKEILSPRSGPVSQPHDALLKQKKQIPLQPVSQMKNGDGNDPNDLTDFSDGHTEDADLTVYALLTTTKLNHGLMIWTLLVMGFMMYQEMNPVYMAQALSFSSQLIGYAMAFSGGSLLVFTYSIQPWFIRTFRHRTMCIVCAVASCLVYLQMPSIFTLIDRLEIENEIVFAMILSFINSMLGVVFCSILFVVTMCWVNNAVPQSCVGRANGMGQTTAAFVRAVGPTVTGFIWSGSVDNIDSNPVAVYWAYLPSFTCCALIALWIYLFIDDDMQLTFEQRQTRTKSNKIHVKS